MNLRFPKLLVFEKQTMTNCQLRNPGRDISFPIFTRIEVETNRIGKEIKTIISRLNDLSSFLTNIEQNRNQNQSAEGAGGLGIIRSNKVGKTE